MTTLAQIADAASLANHVRSDVRPSSKATIPDADHTASEGSGAESKQTSFHSMLRHYVSSDSGRKDAGRHNAGGEKQHKSGDSKPARELATPVGILAAAQDVLPPQTVLRGAVGAPTDGNTSEATSDEPVSSGDGTFLISNNPGISNQSGDAGLAVTLGNPSSIGGGAVVAGGIRADEATETDLKTNSTAGSESAGTTKGQPSAGGTQEISTALAQNAGLSEDSTGDAQAVAGISLGSQDKAQAGQSRADLARLNTPQVLLKNALATPDLGPRAVSPSVKKAESESPKSTDESGMKTVPVSPDAGQAQNLKITSVTVPSAEQTLDQSGQGNAGNPVIPPVPPETTQETNEARTAESGALAFAARLSDSESTEPDSAGNSADQASASATRAQSFAAQVTQAKAAVAGLASGDATSEKSNNGSAERFVKADSQAIPVISTAASHATAASVKADAPASPEGPHTAGHIEEPREAPTNSSRDFTVRIPASGAGSSAQTSAGSGAEISDRGTDVRFVERGGEVHVSVRTGDGELAQTLRGGLGDLMERLGQSGIQAEVWQPPAAPGSSQDDSARSYQDQNSSNGGGGHPQGSHSGKQNQSEENKPRWVEELESSIGKPVMEAK